MQNGGGVVRWRDDPGDAHYYCKARFKDEKAAKEATFFLRSLCAKFIKADAQVGASDNELEEEYKFIWKKWPDIPKFLDLPLPQLYNKQAYTELDEALAFHHDVKVQRDDVFLYIDAECHESKDLDAFCDGIKRKWPGTVVDWINEEQVEPWMCLHV